MRKRECIVTGIIASFMNLESKWTNHVLNRTTDAKCGAVHNHRAPTRGWKNPSFREGILSDGSGSLVSGSIPCPGLRSKGTPLRKGLWKTHGVARRCTWFNFTTACLNLASAAERKCCCRLGVFSGYYSSPHKYSCNKSYMTFLVTVKYEHGAFGYHCPPLAQEVAQLQLQAP